MTDAEPLRQEPGRLRGLLRVIAGAPEDAGAYVVFEDEVVVGRGATGLKLHDPWTSRQHCSVQFDERAARYVVRDLGSTNGIRLDDGRSARGKTLEPGGRIFLGATVLELRLVDEPPPRDLRPVGRPASIDPLIGPPASYELKVTLARAAYGCRVGTPLTVLRMHLDGLRAIYDRHGHLVSAHLSYGVWRRLDRLLEDRWEARLNLCEELFASHLPRSRGVACRLGGGELCAYLEGTGVEDAVRFAEDLRRTVQSLSFELEGVIVQTTLSIGVAEARDAASNPDQLLAAAQDALRRAREKGGNCVSN